MALIGVYQILQELKKKIIIGAHEFIQQFLSLFVLAYLRLTSHMIIKSGR